MRLRVTLFASLLIISCAGPLMWHTAVADTSPSSTKSQDVKTDDPKGAAGESDRRKPLPTYYGQLGISDEQRTELQGVQESYEEKLQKLRDELKLLVKERDQKMEILLTAGQKLRLKELRTAARTKEQQKPVEPKAAK